MALLVEQYQEYGLKFDEAMRELQKTLVGEETRAPKPPTESENEAALAMLMAQMTGTDFKGAKRR